ncbi:uncharacterized protein DNG_02084 [Cephalotrichum gorgonifer]|uniref:Vegetative cell wall protein gp1 n=1 Tax=Cephalotrichum gorgonifer TaxID=2041049 RepID=A0AAE8MSP7_9PEZI|nr:uncharacterized protein DNG_02084 [Cephalotrichum gorgonifer]
MSGNNSPYTRSGYSDERSSSYYNSPSPTPSPRPAPHMYGNNYPPRPATRAHFRAPSHSQTYPDPSIRPPTASPRFTSDGKYATETTNVSSRHSSPLYSPSTPRRERYVEVVTLDGYERKVNVSGTLYTAERADFKPSRRRGSVGGYTSPRHSTDFYDAKQSGYLPPRHHHREEIDTSRTPRPGPTKRRPSMSTPQRPSTTRPTSSHRSRPSVDPAAVLRAPRQATEADRAEHKIPSGFSMKNWDPTSPPILLCGSVFDANSLGKWIYDWTIYHHGRDSKPAEIAGKFWLLFIHFSHKVKTVNDISPTVRSKRNRMIVNEYVESAEVLMDDFYDLLKLCEDTMLGLAKRKDATTLGMNAGVEFVKTMFGREVGLTTSFIKRMEVYNKRFDQNCQEILVNPTM